MKIKILLITITLFTITIAGGKIPAQAQEPLVKFYTNDGNALRYNLADIDSMSFIKSKLSYTMNIYKKDSTINGYDLRTIDSVNFTFNRMLISGGGKKTDEYIWYIDSIIFTGNTCDEIQIGGQIWMCRNLDIGVYRNGDSIEEIKSEAIWATVQAGGWCNYNNSDSLGKIYGKLYNRYAVNDPRGLAPQGWHIPSDSEWTVLSKYLGGDSTAGGKMKEAGLIHWSAPNAAANNETGFTAMPGGYRDNFSFFLDLGAAAKWWTTSTETSGTYPLMRSLSNKDGIITGGETYMTEGLSVRCIKDK